MIALLRSYLPVKGEPPSSHWEAVFLCSGVSLIIIVLGFLSSINAPLIEFFHNPANIIPVPWLPGLSRRYKGTGKQLDLLLLESYLRVFPHPFPVTRIVKNLVYQEKICEPYAECRNDDDLVLYLSKKLR